MYFLFDMDMLFSVYSFKWKLYHCLNIAICLYADVFQIITVEIYPCHMIASEVYIEGPVVVIYRDQD